MKRKLFDEPEVPELVIDLPMTVPRGETVYSMEFDDETVELLAQGVCPEAVAKRCWSLLDWKRAHYRNEAREKVSA